MVKNILIPMRDGVCLAADLYVPDDGHAWDSSGRQYPIVMDYYPYRKDDVLPGMWWYEHLPSYGYVCCRVDVRGTGASSGIATDEYCEQEQLDGYDAIEWLASQEWCTGHVNMIGLSYGGFNSLQVASLRPPHLTSIIPMYFSDDLYSDSDHYKGGLWRQYIDVGWYGNFMLALNALPPYPEWSGADWADIWKQHLEGNEPWTLQWLRHQTDGEFWKRASVRYMPDRIQCPAFLIGGWRDGFPNPPLRLFSLLHVPKKVLIGPWNHLLPDEAIPGPRIDYLHEVSRWLDHWCKGADTGIMEEPPVAIYMQRYDPDLTHRLDSSGEWRAELELSPEGGGQKIFYLAGEGGLRAEPTTAGLDRFSYVADVGVMGGLFSGGIPFGLPGDQRQDEAFSLTYTSEELPEDIHVLGRARVILHAASSASVAAFVVSVSEVATDGTSHLVAKGVLNATRRNSLENPQPLTPGEVYELVIDIDATGWIFTKGNRLRLSIAGSDWPEMWPTPDPCVNEIHRGVDRSSRLILPVVPPTAAVPPPTFLPSPKRVSRHTALARPHTWHVTRDLITDKSILTIEYKREGRVDDLTAWEREYEMVAEVHPQRPATAAIRGRHLTRMLRPTQMIESSSEMAVQGTRDHLHVALNLDVKLNGAPVVERHWIETFPRVLL